MEVLELNGQDLTQQEIVAVSRHHKKVAILTDPLARQKVIGAYDFIINALDTDRIIYFRCAKGNNTSLYHTSSPHNTCHICRKKTPKPLCSTLEGFGANILQRGKRNFSMTHSSCVGITITFTLD